MRKVASVTPCPPQAMVYGRSEGTPVMKVAKCPAAATVYCRKCSRSRQVKTIVKQWRQAQWTTDIVLPNWARMIAGHMVCGHPFHRVATLANLAVMRAWLPVEKERSA